jgi:drug/metabolite transporter (DMT)-like permease
VGWAWSGKAPPRLIWPAVLLSLCGTWLMSGGLYAAPSGGDLLVAAGAVFWGAHVVVTGRAGAYGRPLGFTAAEFAVVTLLAGAGAAFLEMPAWPALWDVRVQVAYVGLLSGAISFSLFTLALRHTHPAEAAIIISTETVFAAAGAYVVFGERLGPSGWIGAALILTAVLALQLGSATRRRPV